LFLGGKMPELGGKMPELGGQVPELGGQMPELGELETHGESAGVCFDLLKKISCDVQNSLWWDALTMWSCQLWVYGG
jgi:hypothetical protein